MNLLALCSEILFFFFFKLQHFCSLQQQSLGDLFQYKSSLSKARIQMEANLNSFKMVTEGRLQSGVMNTHVRASNFINMRRLRCAVAADQTRSLLEAVHSKCHLQGQYRLQGQHYG